MPIFISYSQKDRDFVDRLAQNLIAEQHHVWLDRWELGAGDSLTQKIQSALGTANAILVIISKASVQSEWCKRELNAGLIRELEEKRTIIMPCVIDEVDVPLFLRDKLYANFREDPDAALDLINRSLARFSNPFQGRSEEPQFHTDWSMDWGADENDFYRLRWTFVDHGHHWPYVLLSELIVWCDEKMSNELRCSIKTETHGKFMKAVLSQIVANTTDGELTVKISSPIECAIQVSGPVSNGTPLAAELTYRRLGEDNGMTTIARLRNNLKTALKHMENAILPT